MGLVSILNHKPLSLSFGWQFPALWVLVNSQVYGQISGAGAQSSAEIQSQQTVAHGPNLACSLCFGQPCELRMIFIFLNG